MSAVEVIAEIEKLSRQEQEEVFSYFLSTRRSSSGRAFADDMAFERIAQKVFAEHDELFRKLGQ